MNKNELKQKLHGMDIKTYKKGDDVYVKKDEVIAALQKIAVAEKYYAEIKWNVEDVLSVSDEQNLGLSQEQAQEWLEKNEKYLKEACIVAGNEYINFNI